MKLRTILVVAVCACTLGVAACASNPSGNTSNTSQPTAGKAAGPLPDGAFKAQLAFVDPPAKLRAGEKKTIQVHIKNASDVFWWARGGATNDRSDNKFYIAVGNRWLKPDGSLVTDMDGRYGISKDLKPGEENEVPLTITAPKEPGDYVLEVDLVQEQVSWFHDKGSGTARVKIQVER